MIFIKQLFEYYNYIYSHKRVVLKHSTHNKRLERHGIKYVKQNKIKLKKTFIIIFAKIEIPEKEKVKINYWISNPTS